MNTIEEVKKAIIKLNFKLPSNLNLNDLLNEFGTPKFKRGKFNLLSAKLIIEDLFKRCDTDQYSESYGYSKLSSKRLEKKVYNYKEYLDWFGSVGIILDKHNYRTGHYPNSFGLNAEYYKSKMHNVLATKAEIRKKLKKLAEKQLPEDFIRNNFHLFKGFSNKLKFDSTLTIATIEKQFVDSEGNLDVNMVQSTKRQINSINKSHFKYFSVDKFGERFYSPISNLKKIFRKYLRYNGGILIELDIKNSLPYFLNILIKRNCEIVEDTNIKEEKLHSIMFNKLIDNRLKINKSEFDHYLNLTSTGRIYEFFLEYLERKNGEFYLDDLEGYNEDNEKVLYSEMYPLWKFESKFEQKRAICKKILIKHLFWKNNEEEEVDAFYNEFFPSILKFIESRKIDKSLGYKQISKELQKLESTYILKIISKEFCIENPEAVVFTIHDCIATQDIYYKNLRKKAEEVFLRELSAHPSFHDIMWCVECDSLPEVA